jgi:ABC-type antimicrobial peptide transport system permease subunit
LALAVDPRVEIVGNTWADRAGTTVEQHLEGVIGPQRVATAWVGAFGLVALVLAGIGLYGVVAQTVLLRTRELAVRSALGATPGGLLALVVRDGMRLAIGGAAIGAVVSLSGIGVLRRLVASVEVADARAAVIAVVALALVMLAASYLPARWVARLNPIDALRCD